MSDFNAVSVIFALVLVDVFVYIYLDRWFEERVDTIVTGVIRGVSVPIEHRRMLLHARFVFRGVIQIFQLALVSLALWQLGSFATNEQVAVVAYLGSSSGLNVGTSPRAASDPAITILAPAASNWRRRMSMVKR